ncbi:MAG TPA: hypothetical protein PK367_02490 [Candidatus Paceibacterota bacterium]|nr:hypothetical protein [Candidatus Paceibacterota bacterium]
MKKVAVGLFVLLLVSFTAVFFSISWLSGQGLLDVFLSAPMIEMVNPTPLPAYYTGMERMILAFVFVGTSLIFLLMVWFVTRFLEVVYDWRLTWAVVVILFLTITTARLYFIFGVFS